jgi:hypothetical protein
MKSKIILEIDSTERTILMDALDVYKEYLIKNVSNTSEICVSVFMDITETVEEMKKELESL